MRDFYVSGVTDEERERWSQWLQDPGPLDYLNNAKGPVRLRDMAAQPDSLGLPADHPPVQTFLGMPIYYRDERVGSIYLAEKEGAPEFTEEDEIMAAMFAAHAASIISNARRYEAEHRAKADLETLLDISPVGVVVFNAHNGELAYLNQETLRMMGSLEIPEEGFDNLFEALSFRRADGSEMSYLELPAPRVLQNAEPVRAEEILIQSPSGKSIPTVISAAPIFSGSGEIVSVVHVVQDMTPVADLERQRAAFLGRVSEELRTPLISIKGSAAALRGLVESVTTTEPMQLLRIIDQQTDLMRSQITSLIELTQIETGTLSVDAEPTDLSILIPKYCGEFLRDHGANSIETDIAGGLPRVMADGHRIGQVLQNFLRQVARHSDDASPIRVSASLVDIHVAISVSVEGPFAPSAEPPQMSQYQDVPQLFKDIAESHAKAVDMASQGEGLAIAFCRGVVEAHGGRIRTDIDAETGSLTLTFTLLSVEDEEDFQAPDSPQISGDPMPASAEGIRILVSIEDPRLLRTVRQVLLNAGYGAVAASGLREVEELAWSERPKLIILDIAGREEEAFPTLRRAGDSLNLPAIVLCDRDDEEYVVRAFDMGADGYMVKPFSPSEMIARIKATLRRLNVGREITGSRTFQSGEVHINFDERTVKVSDRLVQLTATEYKLLTEFANSAGRVLTQDALLQRVWGPEYSGDPQLLRSYIKSLRQKLGDNARKPSYIFTEHGVGYRMGKS